VTRERSRHTILVVEDDRRVRGLIASHLRRRRHEVTAVGAAEAALRELRSNALAYDVALVDNHLPGISGVELIRLLLATRPLSPIIMITGDDDTRLARKALEQGVSAYLLKPFRLFELDAALAQALALLDLVETTEALARSRARGLDEWEAAGGALPRSWLDLVDDRSGAGAGHGERVARIADVLARACGLDLDVRDRDHIAAAARAHEIGRLTGAGAEGSVPHRSAQLLSDLGFDARVATLVRHASESWSSALSAPARVLGLADQLDHEAARRTDRGEAPDAALQGAVDALFRRAGDDVDPDLCGTLVAQRNRIQDVWMLREAPVPA
jgi:CheY-like chemotaxis protein